MKKKKDRGIWNIEGYERDWKLYPKHLDFLSKNSPNYRIKAIQRDIYMDIIKKYIIRMSKGSNILDVGGGIGRFAIPLAKLGYNVHLIDASKTNIEIAKKHIKKQGLDNKINFYLARAEDLSFIEDNTIDLCLGIELVCYSEYPKTIIEEMKRITKNNKLIILSVEGKYGSLISDEKITANEFNEILKNSELGIKDYIYIKYYTKEEFQKLLESVKLKIVELEGTHYTLDGIFHRVTCKMSKEKIISIERMCRQNPILKSLARSWIAVCKVKK